MKNNKTTINKTQAVELMENSKGRYFTVTFATKNNPNRVMNCNCKKGAKTALGYLRVYSPKDKGYRSVNPQTVNALKINNITYKVK